MKVIITCNKKSSSMGLKCRAWPLVRVRLEPDCVFHHSCCFLYSQNRQRRTWPNAECGSFFYIWNLQNEHTFDLMISVSRTKVSPVVNCVTPSYALWIAGAYKYMYQCASHQSCPILIAEILEKRVHRERVADRSMHRWAHARVRRYELRAQWAPRRK